MMTKRIIILAIAVILISGCASKFSCMETIDGVKCKNIQGVYDAKVTATGIYNGQVAVDPTPKKRKEGKDQDKDKAVAPEKILTEKEAIIQHLEISDPRPIRLPPIVLRIWTAPWEDADGDLHNAGYIYTEVEQRRGRWLFGEGTVKGAGGSIQTKVHSVQGTASRTPQKEESTIKKTEENKTDKYYGQKPPADMPKLKLSK